MDVLLRAMRKTIRLDPDSRPSHAARYRLTRAEQEALDAYLADRLPKLVERLAQAMEWHGVSGGPHALGTTQSRATRRASTNGEFMAIRIRKPKPRPRPRPDPTGP